MSVMYEFLDRRYALALYEIAQKRGKVREFLSELKEVQEEIQECDDVDIILEHPNVGLADRKNIFRSVWKGKISDEVLNFLIFLIQKDRIKYLKEKIYQYEKIMEKNAEILRVRIRSAVELKEVQENKIKEILGKKTGKEIYIEKEIDKEIIGGCILKYNDTVLDYSIKSRIDSMIQGGEKNAY